MLANTSAFREDAGMDAEADGLLAGLEGDERAARQKLLEHLAEDGFTAEELAKHENSIRRWGISSAVLNLTDRQLAA